MRGKPCVLFLCVANSSRSQMAEGWLRHLTRQRVEALSAGTHPSAVHPLAVRVMAEVGVDLSRHSADPLAAHLEDPPHLVIAVCSAAAACCPTLPGRIPMLAWPFEEPGARHGGEPELLRAFRATRDALEQRLRAWIECGYPGLPVEALALFAR